MSIKSPNLTPDLYQYILTYSLRESPVLDTLRQQTQKMPECNMQISPIQGQWMAFLVRLMGAKKILEIGTYTGYSSLVMALAMPDDGKILACDINYEWTKIAKKFWDEAGVSHKIELRLQPALLTLDELLEKNNHNSFDMAFIDADKANYFDYYERCLELIRDGGVIIIDNVLWGGQVTQHPDDQDRDTRAIHRLNAHIAKDSRVEVCMLPISDGVTLAIKKPTS